MLRCLDTLLACLFAQPGVQSKATWRAAGGQRGWWRTAALAAGLAALVGSAAAARLAQAALQPFWQPAQAAALPSAESIALHSKFTLLVGRLGQRVGMSGAGTAGGAMLGREGHVRQGSTFSIHPMLGPPMAGHVLQRTPRELALLRLALQPVPVSRCASELVPASGGGVPWLPCRVSGTCTCVSLVACSRARACMLGLSVGCCYGLSHQP